MTLAGILHHFNNRLSEVGAASIMIGYGITLLVAPAAADAHSFDLLGNILADPFLAPAFLLVGLVRFAALVANGAWPNYGPLMRAAGACIGGGIWSQMFLSLVAFGQPSLGFSIYLVLTGLELTSFYRALAGWHGKRRKQGV